MHSPPFTCLTSPLTHPISEPAALRHGPAINSMHQTEEFRGQSLQRGCSGPLELPPSQYLQYLNSGHF